MGDVMDGGGQQRSICCGRTYYIWELEAIPAVVTSHGGQAAAWTADLEGGDLAGPLPGSRL